MRRRGMREVEEGGPCGWHSSESIERGDSARLVGLVVSWGRHVWRGNMTAELALGRGLLKRVDTHRRGGYWRRKHSWR